MAYAVTHRTQEIGVRMAVGAQRSDVSWLFLRRALMQLAISVGIGIPAALALSRVAQFRLVDIEPGDPITMLSITAIVILVTLLSCLLPVSKASKIDPVNALRAD
jgi:ABC-type antimicrobial peptide transport system permease subunit